MNFLCYTDKLLTSKLENASEEEKVNSFNRFDHLQRCLEQLPDALKAELHVIDTEIKNYLDSQREIKTIRINNETQACCLNFNRQFEEFVQKSGYKNIMNYFIFYQKIPSNIDEEQYKEIQCDCDEYFNAFTREESEFWKESMSEKNKLVELLAESIEEEFLDNIDMYIKTLLKNLHDQRWNILAKAPLRELLVKYNNLFIIF